jgi:hypothetical protein
MGDERNLMEDGLCAILILDFSCDSYRDKIYELLFVFDLYFGD